MRRSPRPFTRRSRRRAGVDTHDIGAFRRVSIRTRTLRLALAWSAAALVLAAVAVSRDPATNDRSLVPPDRIGVVVLDLSLSITDDDYAKIRRTLRRLVAEEASIGLVVFSDVPYELLPPGTPAAELESLLRLLVAPRLGPVINPWTQTFRAGTRISTALELARSTLARDEVAAGSILLVSDLETAPDDVPALVQTISALGDADIQLRVVPLAPSSDGLSLFAGLLDEDAIAGFAAPVPDRDGAEVAATSTEAPVVFLLLGALMFLALAGHEWLGGRIALPRAEDAEGVTP